MFRKEKKYVWVWSSIESFPIKDADKVKDAAACGSKSIVTSRPTGKIIPNPGLFYRVKLTRIHRYTTRNHFKILSDSVYAN